MPIKRQVIKLKVGKMKKEELSTKSHEATRNEPARRGLKKFRAGSCDFVERMLTSL